MTVQADAPFVVRNSARRFVAQTVLSLVFVVGGIALSFSYLTAGLILLLPGVFMLVMSLLSLRNLAPLLAADERGVTLQAFAGPDAVRSWAWEDIERIYVHRISRQFRMLCVLPRDVDAELAAFAAKRATLEKSIGVCGAPYSVNLAAAGISDEQAGRSLRELAADRTHVELPA